MTTLTMTPDVLELLGERFKLLAEPARLRMLSLMRDVEMTVSELVAASGLGQANVSRHLQLLYSLGFVNRRKEGLHVYYSLADQRVFELCEIMCGRLETERTTRRRVLPS